MVNHNLTKGMKRISYKPYKSRYDDILKIIKNGELWSISEIKKELSINMDISIQGINKNLEQMLLRKEIGYLDNNKNNKDIITKAYNKKTNKKIKKYYIYTPLSFGLYNRLKNSVGDAKRFEKYKTQIIEIVDLYRALEIVSKDQKYEFKNEDAIKKGIKEGNKLKENLTKKIIERKKEDAEKRVQEFSKKDFGINMNVNAIKIGEGYYLPINDDYISLNKLVNFFKILKMPPYMKYLGDADKVNRKMFLLPITQKLTNLFIQLVKDSQIKFD